MTGRLKQKRLEEFIQDIKSVFDEWVENTDIPLADLTRSADLFIDTLKKENAKIE